MKIIFFNINHCKIDRQGVLEFIDEHIETADVFCFQEAEDIAESVLDPHLRDFTKFTAYKFLNSDNIYQLCTYISKKYEICEKENVMADNPLLSVGIFVKILINGNELNIFNYHGRARPAEKLDVPERITEMEEIVRYLGSKAGATVIGGDFNMLPNVASLKKLESAGYESLIRKYSIQTTRNEVAWKKFPDNKQYFSDYVFINNKVKVQNFTVPYTEISDHLPLLLTFDLIS